MLEMRQNNRIKYTVGEVKRNAFYQLPKFLFTDEFKAMSNDARMLYSLLRDRHDLSVKNQWVNENNEVYIFFSREHMCEILGISRGTVLKSMDMLKKLNLIEEERQGLGLPNKIYLLTVENVENTPKFQIDPSERPKNVENTQRSKICTSGDPKFEHRQNVENTQRSKICTSGDPTFRHPNVQTLAPSQTENSDTKKNTLSQSQSQSQTAGEYTFVKDSVKNPDGTLTLDDDKTSRERVANDEPKKRPPALTPVSETYRQAEAPKKFSANNYTTYAELVKSNIDFESFSDPDDRKLAGSLIEIMLDVILTESPNMVKIGKEMKGRDIVRSVYLKLNHDHIAHVMSQYRAQFRKIIFKGAYLRTTLFNTYIELEAAVANKKAVAACPEQELRPQPLAKETPHNKNRFINFNQREIDFEELERLELEQLRASMKD